MNKINSRHFVICESSNQTKPFEFLLEDPLFPSSSTNVKFKETFVVLGDGVGATVVVVSGNGAFVVGVVVAGGCCGKVVAKTNGLQDKGCWGKILLVKIATIFT